MDRDVFIAFVGVSALLIVIPGPNVLLIASNSIAHGRRRGLSTLAGTSSTMVLQLAIAIVGMTSFMIVLSEWFEWLRWCGVVYLVVSGVRQWRLASREDGADRLPSARRAYAQGFLVSLTNPKTLLFFAAFLPQFVDPSSPAFPQLLVLGIVFFSLATLIDGAYAVLGGRLRGAFLEPERARFRRRLSGSLLVGAGVGLAVARRS